MLGETIPSNISTQFSPDKNKTSPLHDMMTLVRGVILILLIFIIFLSLEKNLLAQTIGEL